MTPVTPEQAEEPLRVEATQAHASDWSASSASEADLCAEYDAKEHSDSDDEPDRLSASNSEVDEVEVELPAALSEQLEAEAELAAESMDQMRPVKTVAHVLCSVPEVVSSGSHLKGSAAGVQLVGTELPAAAQRWLTYWAEAGAVVAHSLDKVYCVVGILDNVMGRRPFWRALTTAECWVVGVTVPPLTLASLVAGLNKTWRTNVGESSSLRLFWTSYTGLLDLPDILYSNVLLLTDFLHRRHRQRVPAQCRRARVAAAQRCMLTALQLSDADVHRGLLADVLAAHHRYQLDCACGACLEPTQADGTGSHGHSHGAAHAHHQQHSTALTGSVSGGDSLLLVGSDGDLDPSLGSSRSRAAARFASMASYGSAGTHLIDQSEATTSGASAPHADVREHLATHQKLLRQYRGNAAASPEAQELESLSASTHSSAAGSLEVESESLLARDDERLLADGERPRELALAVQHRVDKRLRLARKLLAFAVGVPLSAVTYFVKGVSAAEGLKLLMPTWLAYIFAVVTVLSLAYIQWRLPTGFVKYVFDKLTLPRREHVRDPFYVFHPVLSILLALVSLFFSCGGFFSAYNAAAKITKAWTIVELQAIVSYLYGIHYVLYGTHACILIMSYGANKLKAATNPLYRQRMAALACLQEHKQTSIDSSAPKHS
jgi:hypothetical protein